MKVTVCVVSWNTAAHLGAGLQTLTAQTHPDLDLVVIDNASADDSVAVARRFSDVRVVANTRNRGFAGAANQAVTLARAHGSDALFVCNPDVRLEPDHLAHAVDALRGGHRRAAVQGKLWRLGPDDPGRARVLDGTGHVAFRTRLFRNRGYGEFDAGQFDTPAEVFGVSGAAALYRLDALDDVACDGEVFDEDLFAFWEDVDLDWRLQMRGWQAWYTPAACGWHERGGVGIRRSAIVERLNFTNRFLVVAKNDDPRALAGALPGVTVTTLLKTGELAVTVPTAFLSALPRLRLLGSSLRKRRLVHGRAVVPSALVVDRWFAPFEYSAWVRAWWRRVRGRHASAHSFPDSDQPLP